MNTGASTATCSDPYGEGCTRTVTPGLSLPRSPHRQKKGPCQQCRRRLTAEAREAAGRPPIRAGRGTWERL